MKVLHVITSLDDGGAQALLCQICRCSMSGVIHEVVSLKGEGKYVSELELKGVLVKKLHMSNVLFVLSEFIKLILIIRESNPDVVQTWLYHGDFFGGIAAKLLGVKKIVWGIHNTTLVRGKSSKLTIYLVHVLARLSFYIPDEIVCCARTAVNMHVKLGYCEPKMRLIYNGCDTTMFFPDAASRKRFRESLGVSESEFLLASVARMSPQKDFANLLESLTILKSEKLQFKCIIAGSGTKQLVELAQSLGLLDVVFFLGHRSDIPNIMRSIDLLVLSSSFGEACPVVLLEALASETLCVSTDVGDCSLLLDNLGFVVPCRDPKKLSEAIKEMMYKRNYVSDWIETKKQARQRVKNRFELTSMARQYFQVWCE